jgi:hypothetical protein
MRAVATAACALILSLGCANITLTERYENGHLVERIVEQRCFARVCEATIKAGGEQRENEEYAMALRAKRESGWVGVISGVVAGLLSGLAL